MRVLSEQETLRLEEIVNRLRTVQFDLENPSAQARQELIQEEVRRALSEVPPNARKMYLEHLVARFPVRGSILAPAGGAREPAVSDAPFRTPEEMTEYFLKELAAVPEEERKKLGAMLQQSDILRPYSQGGLNSTILAQLRAELRLEPDQSIDESRIAPLLILLVGLLQDLEKTVAATSHDISNRPANTLSERNSEFRRSAGQYLSGDSAPLQKQISRVRLLLGGLLAALLGGGKEFGKRFLDKLSPERIDDVVAGAGQARFGILGPTRKERCWEHYKLLIADYATPDLLNRALKECFRDFIEKAKAAPEGRGVREQANNG